MQSFPAVNVLSSVLFVVLIKTKKAVYIRTNYFLINRTSVAISAIRYVFFVKKPISYFSEKALHSKILTTFPLVFKNRSAKKFKFQNCPVLYDTGVLACQCGVEHKSAVTVPRMASRFAT